MDQLPRLGKRELICLLLFTCNYVVSVWRGFLFLWVLRMGYVILLWHSLSLPYNYLGLKTCKISRLSVKKINFDLSTYLRGYNSIDMVPPPLANSGSNSTIAVLLCHIKYF